MTKERGRDYVHIEERPVIGRQQDRALSRHSLDVLEAIDLHEVVGSKMNPAGAENTLAPRPEALPIAMINPTNETKSASLE